MGHETDAARLESQTGDPLYVQVSSRLRHMIADGTFAGGAKLPPERELAEEFHVSRITLRSALRLLADEHLIVRGRGVGTFVASGRLRFPVVGLHSTRDIERAHGLEVTVRVCDFSLTKATRIESEQLDLGAQKSVVKFTRIDIVDGDPICVADCVLPGRFAKYLSAEACEKSSTYELLESGLGIRISSASQRVFADGANDRLAKLLNVQPGCPLLRVERITLDSSELPVEWACISYPHFESEFSMQLLRDSVSKRESTTHVRMTYSRIPIAGSRKRA